MEEWWMLSSVTLGLKVGPSVLTGEGAQSLCISVATLVGSCWKTIKWEEKGEVGAGLH